MRTTNHLLLCLAAVAVALGGGALIAGPTPSPQLRADSDCPTGQAADDEDRWQCVHECPPGMLYDGESDVCVAPPGVPPPALSPQPPESPQISADLTPRVWPPAVIDDETGVLSCAPQEELVLLARLGPAGAARITLRLSDIPDGCRVEMAEVAVEGPMCFLLNRPQLAGFWPRNRECTWRLANLAEQRDPDEFE